MSKPSHIYLITINVCIGLMANDIHIDVSPRLKQSGVLDKSEYKRCNYSNQYSNLPQQTFSTQIQR